MTLAFAGPAAQAQQAAGESLTPTQQEVMEQLRQLPIGPVTLEVQNLPDEYLRRVADRIIRASFQREQRMVVRDQHAGTSVIPTPEPALPTSRPVSTGRGVGWLPMAIGVSVIVLVAIVMLRRGEGGAK